MSDHEFALAHQFSFPAKAAWGNETLSEMEDLQKRLAVALQHNINLELHNQSLREKNRDLVYKAEHDGLTGLKNDSYLMRALEQASSFNELRQPSHLDAILMIDLNGFKQINDTYGHEAGDAAIQFAAASLQVRVRESDVVARPHGDEFVILLRGITEEGAHKKREEIANMFEGLSFVYNGSHLAIGGSVGIKIIDTSLPAEANLKAADDDMYEQKRARKKTAQLSLGV